MDDTKLKSGADHIEDLDVVKDSDILQGEVAVMGTVKLTQGKVIYIPTPTADPQGENSHDVLRDIFDTEANRVTDPLNMSLWQKYMVLIVISICK